MHERRIQLCSFVAEMNRQHNLIRRLFERGFGTLIFLSDLTVRRGADAPNIYRWAAFLNLKGRSHELILTLMTAEAWAPRNAASDGGEEETRCEGSCKLWRPPREKPGYVSLKTSSAPLPLRLASDRVKEAAEDLCSFCPGTAAQWEQAAPASVKRTQRGIIFSFCGLIYSAGPRTQSSVISRARSPSSPLVSAWGRWLEAVVAATPESVAKLWRWRCILGNADGRFCQRGMCEKNTKLSIVSWMIQKCSSNTF